MSIYTETQILALPVLKLAKVAVDRDIQNIHR